MSTPQQQGDDSKDKGSKPEEPQEAKVRGFDSIRLKGAVHRIVSRSYHIHMRQVD